MALFSDIILLVYALCACLLFIYGVNCYLMVWFFCRSFRRESKTLREFIDRTQTMFENEDQLPHVTTQIPLYNEANVVERVMRAAAAMDYPSHKHEIQILDDSNDETCRIVDRVANELRNAGKDITVIRREERVGFKAGALQAGMAHCKGEYIAIFDGDFVPQEDYLRNMVPVLFHNDRLGFIQARWGHLNPHHSLLTQAQSIGIDGHFMVEQSARAYNGLFMNFNGTAGVWRKIAIDDAGGWESDTLTEDMDLSYRCQLAGWQASYIADVVVPAELPETYTAFKSQQFRWAKGSIQTAVKLMPRVARSEASLLTKLQAFFHMTHYSIHPLMALLALLAWPVLLTLDITMPTPLIALSALGIGIAMFGPSTMYVMSQWYNPSTGLRRLYYLPLLMCVGVGIALSNTRAVFEALLGIKSAFIRTPKRGDQTLKTYKAKTPVLPMFEIVLGLYCAASLWTYLEAQKYLVGPFLLIYATGFLLVGVSTLRENTR